MPTAFQTLRRFAWERSSLLRRPLEGAAAELEGMLATNYPWQANVVRELRLAVERGDAREAERRFSSGDIWGGAGSVSDVTFLSPEVDKRSWRLFIRLVRGFALAGIHLAPATDKASIYRTWLRDL
jgi:hypothetical protein